MFFFPALVCLATLPAAAQPTGLLKQSLSAGFVAGAPVNSNGPGSPALNAAAGYRLGYSFRALSRLEVEAGFEQIVRPSGSSVCCEYVRNADDELFLVPFGARYVAEPADGRYRFTFGGGGAYLNHSIGNDGNGLYGGFAGWGGQLVASGDFAPGKSRRLRLGVTARYYFSKPRASLQFPTGAALTDTVHLFVVGPEITFAFHGPR